MKILFDNHDSNYVEIVLTSLDKYQLAISVQDSKNPLTTIVNSVELTIAQLSTLILDLGYSLVALNSGLNKG